MSKVERFEDLKCWQAARELVRDVYILCDEGKLAKDFETRVQIKKAALGGMNNIAEGFGRFSKKDLFVFLTSPRVRFKKCKASHTYYPI